MPVPGVMFNVGNIVAVSVTVALITGECDEVGVSEHVGLTVHVGERVGVSVIVP